MLSTTPALTAVVIIGNNRKRVQRTLRSILEQDIADQIVIMVFDRADRPARDLPELTQANTIYEPIDNDSTPGRLQARATLAASTDIIAFVEDHVVVPAGWARESLRRHREGYTGVTGTIDSGNPHHRWARIVFSITYGPYILSKEPGETTEIPGTNSSFIRSKLLRFETELALLLGSPILLVRRLAAEGERFYRASDLPLQHWNDLRFFDNWIALFYSSQIYICNLLTLEKWSAIRRALRFLITPLVPFVRARRNYVVAKQNGASMKQFFADLPAAFLFHIGSTMGMAAGLLFGYQNSERKFAECETTAESWD